MRILLAILFLLMLASPMAADVPPEIEEIPIQAEERDQASDEAAGCQRLRETDADEATLAQRGCCSWHDGVCGCGGSRLRCCDGTLSPTCGC